MIVSATTAMLYSLAIQYKKGGAWEICRLLVVPTIVLNMLANYTELALIFGKPRPKEYTISRRVRRMANDPNEIPSRRELARMVQVFLDAAEPDGKH